MNIFEMILILNQNNIIKKKNKCLFFNDLLSSSHLNKVVQFELFIVR